MTPTGAADQSTIDETRAAELRRPPLRIVHTVSSLRCGGMENFVIRLSAWQQRRGHEVSVLALDGGALLPSALAQGLKVLALGPWGRPVRLLRGLAFLAGRLPDVIHAHNATSLHFAAAGKNSTDAKLVFTDHGVLIMRQPAPWEVRTTDAVVAVSHKTAADHRTAYGSGVSFKVIHNGISLSPSADPAGIRESLNLPEGFTGVIVARLEPVKGHEMLLRAYGLLHQRGIPVNLLIVGEGSEQPRLQTLVTQLGLSSDRIRFLQFRSDVPSLLAASDFFVLSSRDEGLPLALLEAMSQGLPVVATNVGGVPEVVTNGQHGLLVPSGDAQAMADAIGLMARDPALCLRIAAAGQQRVNQTFTFENTASSYEDLYYQLQTTLG